MTEKEAIEIIKQVPLYRYECELEKGRQSDLFKALYMAIQALEEIQQYRAIGTVKEIRIREAQFKRLSEGYLVDLTSQREYRAIGTIEELQALKEKNEPKKVNEDDCCPICHTYGKDDNGVAGDYCPECGQKLDW